MNPEESLTPVPATVGVQVPALPQFGPQNQRTGKIARLPKTTRDEINQMIQDNVPYLKILERFGLDAEGVTEKNMSNWKAGGYQDWLHEIQLAQSIKAKHELAENIVEQASDGNQAGQAVLKVIATNLCEFLVETDPHQLRDSLLSDSDKFTRFVNAMVRLAEGGIKCELHKYHSQDRAAKAAKDQKRAEAPGISEETLREAEEKLRLM